MSKNQPRKVELLAETISWVVFVIAAGIGALSLLNMISLTDKAQAVVGYILGGYALLVFSYLVYKAVENQK